MTITASATKYRYEGNGVTATFSYLNRVYAQTDLKVDLLTRSTSALVQTLTLTTDYTVTIAANGQATVTIINGAKIPSLTQDILVRLDLPLTQTTELPTGTAFPAKSVENAVDKLTSITQTLAEVDARTLKFSAQSPVTNAVIANPVADSTLVFDGTTGAIKVGATLGEIEDAAANAATATAAAASAAASAAAVSEFDLTGTPAANDAILWDTGGAKFIRKTIAQLKTALAYGTAANQNTGTSGANVPLLSTANTFGATQTISQATTVPLVLQNTSALGSLIQFIGNGASRGFIGSNDSLSLQVIRDVGTDTTFSVSQAGTGSLLAGLFLGNANQAGVSILDWYEEGTFTPGLAAVGPAPTYSVQVGNYTRIGNAVRVNGTVTITAWAGGSGQMSITGLPFTSNAANGHSSAAVYLNNIITGASLVCQPLNFANASTIVLNNYSQTTGVESAVPFDAAFTVHFNLTYRV